MELLVFAVLLLPLLLVINRTRRQQKQMAELQRELAPGLEVMTTSGLFGTVVEVRDDVVVLESSPGQHQRWVRAAVARVVRTAAAPDAGSTPTDTRETGPAGSTGSSAAPDGA